MSENQDILARLLDECAKAGYKRVAIHRLCNGIKSSKDWPFSHYGSVFTSPDCRNSYGHPAIWDICHKIGISLGCGNTQQHQVSLDCEPQTWFLMRGTWKKIK